MPTFTTDRETYIQRLMDAFGGPTLPRIVAELAWARVQQSYSHRDLGRRLNVAHNTICYWECGTCVPSSRQLVLWADTLGFDVILVPKEVA